MITITKVPAPPPEEKRKRQTMPKYQAEEAGISWDRLKLEFISENLSPTRKDPFTLRHLSDKYQVSYGSVRNRAAREKWVDELESLRAQRDATAMTVARDIQMINEVQVRIEQAQFARIATDKAMERIANIDPAKLTVKEAVLLLRLGLQEERKALGLETQYDTAKLQPNTGKSPTEEAVSVAMNILDGLARRRKQDNAVEGEFRVERDDD